MSDTLDKCPLCGEVKFSQSDKCEDCYWESKSPAPDSEADSSAESDTPKYQNRGGEVWEWTPDGWRELFAKNIIDKLESYDRDLAKARQELDERTQYAMGLETHIGNASRENGLIKQQLATAREEQAAQKAITSDITVKFMDSQLQLATARESFRNIAEECEPIADRFGASSEAKTLARKTLSIIKKALAAIEGGKQ